MNAMVFAAGLGTRLKPLTDTMPKALVPVGGRPLLDHVLEKLSAAGATEIVVNVHHFANQIKAHLASTATSPDGLARPGFSYPSIKISDETALLLDTGGGLKKALSLFSSAEPVLIHNVDILSNVDLADFYKQAQPYDVALLVSERKTTRYLLFNDEMRLVGWTNLQTGEVKSPHPEIKALAGSDPARSGLRMYAFAGIHCVKPSVGVLMAGWPDRFPIIDFYLQVCAQADIRGLLKEDLRLLDVGKTGSLADAERFLATSTLHPKQTN